MQRRTFVKNSIGLLAGGAFLPYQMVAAAPCPPNLGAGVAYCGDSSLADAANALSLGQSSDFIRNSLQSEWDIQWQTRTVYYDSNRKELQYAGKPASSQSLNWSHYVFSEATNSWRTTGQGMFPSSGHVWSTAFDPIRGNYYLHRYDENILRYYDRNADQWRQTPSESGLGGDNARALGAIGWHPNLFGAGRGGVLCWGKFRILAFDPASNAWASLGNSSGKFFNRGSGQGAYLSSSDQLVCGAIDASTGGSESVVVCFEAGAGTSSNVIDDGAARFQGLPPTPIHGAGGTSSHGKMVEHPARQGNLLLLEGQGASRVWESNDAGASWNVQSFQHPFNSMASSSNGAFTIGVVPDYNVVIGMSSDSNGGDTRIWKPNA